MVQEWYHNITRMITLDEDFAESSENVRYIRKKNL